MHLENSSPVRHHSISRRKCLQIAGASAIGLYVNRGFALAQDNAGDALPEFPIVAVEYSFDLPAEIPGGWTRVAFDNQGTMDHQAVLLKVRDGATLEALQAALQTPDLGAILALAESVGGTGCGPGLSASVVVDLAPGDYVAVCMIPGDDNIPHYLKGQQAPFSVTESDATGTPPSAGLSVSMSEMTFSGLPAELPAGPQVWEVTNAGTQPHELTLVKLAEGMTIEQGFQIFGVGAESATPGDGAMASMEPESGTPAGGSMAMQGPPFVAIGGVSPMSPEQSNLLELDLAPGNYIALCFVPDPASGAPHFMMGMIQGITVA